MYRRYYNRYDKIMPNYSPTNSEDAEAGTDEAEDNTYNDNKYKVQSYDDPEIIVPEKSESDAAVSSVPLRPNLPNAPVPAEGPVGVKRIIGKLDLDDIIILGLIILLLLEDCDDYILIGVLVYLFISGWQN